MANASFERRLIRIANSRPDRCADPTCLIDTQGMVVPERGAGRSSGRPAWHGLVLVLVTAFVVKSALVTLVKEHVYEARLSVIEAAHPIGQAVAWTMQPDPLTGTLAESLRSLAS